MQNNYWKITQACPVPVEQMDVTAKGHYCHSCQKEVINLDELRPQDIVFKEGDHLCGRMTLPQPEAEIMSMGKWSSLLLKWMGVWALMFIPLKKGQAQTTETGKQNIPAGEKKTLGNTKRFVGTVRGHNNRPVRTKVLMTDSTGQTVAETSSITNGRFLMEVDTTKIKGDTLTLTAFDTPYVIKFDTSWVSGYLTDSIYIGHVVTTTNGPCLPQITLGWTVPITITGSSIVLPTESADVLEEAAKGGIQNMHP